MEEEGRMEVARFGAGKPTRTIISGTDQLRYILQMTKLI